MQPGKLALIVFPFELTIRHFRHLVYFSLLGLFFGTHDRLLQLCRSNSTGTSRSFLDGIFWPGEEQADITRLSIGIVDDTSRKLEATRFQMVLPVQIHFMHPSGHCPDPSRFIILSGEFFCGGLVDRWRTGIYDRPPVIATKTAWERYEHYLVLAEIEDMLDSCKARLNDFVGELEIVQALAVLGKLLIPASVQLLLGFLVAATTRITLREETRYR